MHSQVFHRRIISLLLLWIIGLIFGAYLAFSYSAFALQTFRCALSVRPASLSILLVSIFPVAITALALWYPAFFPCFLLILFEGFCRGFCGMIVAIATTHSAWLLRSLFMFGSSLTSVLVWLLLLRFCNSKGTNFAKNVFYSLALSCLIAAIDIFFISPLLADLAKYL